MCARDFAIDIFQGVYTRNFLIAWDDGKDLTNFFLWHWCPQSIPKTSWITGSLCWWNKPTFPHLWTFRPEDRDQRIESMLHRFGRLKGGVKIVFFFWSDRVTKWSERQLQCSQPDRATGQAIAQVFIFFQYPIETQCSSCFSKRNVRNRGFEIFFDVQESLCSTPFQSVFHFSFSFFSWPTSHSWFSYKSKRSSNGRTPQRKNHRPCDSCTKRCIFCSTHQRRTLLVCKKKWCCLKISTASTRGKLGLQSEFSVGMQTSNSKWRFFFEFWDMHFTPKTEPSIHPKKDYYFFMFTLRNSHLSCTLFSSFSGQHFCKLVSLVSFFLQLFLIFIQLNQLLKSWPKPETLKTQQWKMFGHHSDMKIEYIIKGLPFIAFTKIANKSRQTTPWNCHPLCQPLAFHPFKLPHSPSTESPWRIWPSPKIDQASARCEKLYAAKILLINNSHQLFDHE